MSAVGEATDGVRDGQGMGIRPRLSRLRGRIALLLLLALLVGSAGCGAAAPLSRQSKLEDFEYLFRILRDNHPFLALKERISGYDWVAHYEEFKDRISRTKDDGEFAHEIDRVLTLLGSVHTRIAQGYLVESLQSMGGPWTQAALRTSPQTADSWTALAWPDKPGRTFATTYQAGEYYVYASQCPEVQPGMRIVAVNGTPVHDHVCRDLRGVVFLDWDPLRQREYAIGFPPPYPEERVAFTVECPTGETKQITAPGSVDLERYDRTRFTPPVAHSGNVYKDVLGNGLVGYVHVASMAPSEEDRKALLDFFSSIRNLPALIIDIRGNGGGWGGYWLDYIVRPLVTDSIFGSFLLAHRTGDYVKPFIEASRGAQPEYLSREEVMSDPRAKNLPPEVLTDAFAGLSWGRIGTSPADGIGFKGAVFLLVDNRVFSTAEAFAAFAKATGWATVVGGMTRGDGIGDTLALVVLPNSRVALTFPPCLGMNADWTANEEFHTTPDVLVEPSREDLIAWCDACQRGEYPRAGDPTNDTVLRECLRLALKAAVGP